MTIYFEPPGIRGSLVTQWKYEFLATDCDEAMRLDLVDPEALFHQAACSAQQLFELAQGERSYLGDTPGRQVSHSYAMCHEMTAYRRRKGPSNGHR